MSNTVTDIIRQAANVWQSTNERRNGRVLSTEQALAAGLMLPEGFTAVNLRAWDIDCPFYIAVKLTGRTRTFWSTRRYGGLACPTLDTFDIDTTVIDGAIWGVPGLLRDGGTWAVRPEQVL